MSSHNVGHTIKEEDGSKLSKLTNDHILADEDSIIEPPSGEAGFT